MPVRPGCPLVRIKNPKYKYIVSFKLQTITVKNTNTELDNNNVAKQRLQKKCA